MKTFFLFITGFVLAGNLYSQINAQSATGQAATHTVQKAESALFANDAIEVVAVSNGSGTVQKTASFIGAPVTELPPSPSTGGEVQKTTPVLDPSKEKKQD
jgi:hypothetical protein